MSDALYETLLVFRARAVLLDRHLDRMLSSAAALDFPPIDIDALRTRVEETLPAGDMESMLRIVAHRTGEIELTAAPLPARVELRRNRGAVTLLDPSWTREHPRHKTWPNETNEAALKQAALLGCDEAIYVSGDGMLLEGTSTNVFVSVGERSFATPRTGAILPGVMRTWVLEHARLLGIEVSERDVAAAEIQQGGFLTSSLTLFAPVAIVDGIATAVDPSLAVDLRERFREAVTSL